MECTLLGGGIPPQLPLVQILRRAKLPNHRNHQMCGLCGQVGEGMEAVPSTGQVT